MKLHVPHGPYPADPLALAHPEWCSVLRSGRQHIECDCVSFDMANPDYQAYTRQLVLDHVARFGVDGGRIDCAMGGLSNWQPAAGNRPSHSGIRGGLQSESIRRASWTPAGSRCCPGKLPSAALVRAGETSSRHAAVPRDRRCAASS